MKLISFALLALLVHLTFGQIKRVDITMPRGDFESLYQRRLDSKKPLIVTLSVEGNTYKDVKIHFKGKTSLLLPKKPLKIKFEKGAPVPPLFNGSRIMDFNAMYTDKSFMREYLTWEIFKMMEGFGPKEYGYVDLSINGVDNGIHLLIQHIDKDFFRVNNKKLGEFFEAQYDDIPGNLAVISHSDMKKAYENGNENPEDYSSLEDLIAKLNETSDADFANTVNNLFDMKTVYDWFILNSVTMDGDTYAKNYYLYRDPDKSAQQWSVIPWDYDLSFGRDGDVRLQYPNSILNDDFSYDYDPFDAAPNVLRDRLNKDNTLKEEYKKRLKYVLDNIFTEDKLFPMIDNLSAELSDYVKKEPVRWGTFGDFKEQVEALKYFVTARRNYLYSVILDNRVAENDEATLDISGAGSYCFVDHDGKQVALLTFSNTSGLQKVEIHAYPSSSPPGFTGDNFIKRYIEIIPYPSTAHFSAELKWEFENTPELSEIGVGIQNTYALQSYNFAGGSWQEIDSRMNSYGNYVTIPNLSESNCGAGKYFALKLDDNVNSSWIRQKNLYWQRWNDIEVSGEGFVFVLGDDGTMLKSGDGGNTWIEGYMGVHQQFRSVSVLNNVLLYACGMHGYLVKSIDGGHGWQFLKSGTEKNINCVIFKDQQNGWAACDDKTIISTHNGGAAWTSVQIEGAQNIRALVRTGESLVAGDDNGSIFLSDDNGKSWKSVSSKPGNGINRLIRKSDKEIFGVCDKGVVERSLDGGLTWASAQLNTSVNLYAVTFASNNNIYAAGENGEIFRSADGAEWTKDVIQCDNDIQSIAYVGNSGSIIAVGSEGAIIQLR